MTQQRVDGVRHCHHRRVIARDEEADQGDHQLDAGEALAIGFRVEERADGVKVSVFRQVRSGENWVDATVDPQTVTEVEDKILTRARQLRIASANAQS